MWAALGATRQQMELSGRPVDTLGDAAWALHMTTHAAQHGPNFPKPLEDLRRAIGHCGEETWRQAKTLATELDGLDAMSAGLALVAEGRLLATRLELPPAAGRAVLLRASGVRHEALYLSWWWGLPLRRKLPALVVKLFPPPGYLRSTSALATRGRVGLALAYVIRPFALVKRGLRSLSDLLV